jgi:2,3-dimethylmalate lyase
VRETPKSLRTVLDSGKFITAPGVFDMISAKIADTMGFDALYMTGYGVVASQLGLPDAGLATYTDMVRRVEQIASMIQTPLIADGDTGYGGLLNVRHTVRGYESAGAAAIQLEDQQFPKKCGHTPDRRVVSTDEMTRKIAVAAESRRSDDFLIIARTDARTALGLEQAIRRAEAYAAAGADILFIESPESEEEMKQIGSALSRPVLVNLVDGGMTPVLPRTRLEEMGFQIAIYPVTGFLAASAAMESAYTSLSGAGATHEIPVPLYPFEKFSRLMGFEDVWEFERTHAE